ncbi:MAG: hypothetical protein M1837_002520 [Sclerophora amabilis]|nr:MAG: hypothetical protein M1837_002520 [Sclerophora amabilis]
MRVKLGAVLPAFLLFLTLASTAIIINAHEVDSLDVRRVGPNNSTEQTRRKSRRTLSEEDKKLLNTPPPPELRTTLLSPEDREEDLDFWRPYTSLMAPLFPEHNHRHTSYITRGRSREALARKVKAFFEDIHSEGKFGQESIRKGFKIPVPDMHQREEPDVYDIHDLEEDEALSYGPGPGVDNALMDRVFVYYEDCALRSESRRVPQDFIMSPLDDLAGERHFQWTVPEYFYDKLANGPPTQIRADYAAVELEIKDPNTGEYLYWQAGYYTMDWRSWEFLPAWKAGDGTHWLSSRNH